jgi:hypothetical protein
VCGGIEDVHVKNNIAIGATTGDYVSSGLCNSGSAGNNLSQDGTGGLFGGSGNYTATVPSFYDTAVGDYRLTSNNSFIGTGADLSADAQYAFSNDVSLYSRYAPLWDIGASEAPTNIFRSVGSTAVLATGGGNPLYISTAGVATIGGGLPTNVGVGDAIQYDSDNNGSIDKIMFIAYRFSSMQFAVRHADGSVPLAEVPVGNPDYDWSVYRAYGHLSEAVYRRDRSDGSESYLQYGRVR